MASLAKSLGRPALLLARRGPIVSPVSRSFSVSPVSYLPKPPKPADDRPLRPDEFPPVPEYSPELLSAEERSMYERLPPEEQEEFDAENRRLVEEFNDPKKRAKAFEELDRAAADVEKQTPMRFEDPPLKRPGFWGDGEEDEFAEVEDADDNPDDNEITSMGHAELEVHREVREYMRIAAWDMPQLSKLAQPFTLPPETHMLRFRYTTYMGERHPAEPKVVVELSSKDLTPKYLSEAQRQTFLKLAGPRYNPNTDIVRMSCEKFPARSQNKRYLGDLVNKLIKEAKEGDSFADIPLDLRHSKPPKPSLRFPESWNLTEERRQALEAKRAQSQQMKRLGVDGNAIAVEAAKKLPSLQPMRPAQERVPVGARLGRKLR